MTANTENRLSASYVTTRMLASLPRGASPQLRDPWDAVALFCHSAMLAVGFRLLGLGEDHRIGIVAISTEDEASLQLTLPPQKPRLTRTIPPRCRRNGTPRRPPITLFATSTTTLPWST